MAEESAPQNPAPESAPVAAPVAAPEAVEPVAVESAPEAAPEVKEETAQTVLGAEGVKSEIKPEESPKADAEPKPLPVFDAFTLPEDTKLSEGEVTEITSMLGNFENISGAKHEEVQKFGQALVEYGTAKVKDALEAQQKLFHESWTRQTQDWLKEFENDPEIGGNRKDTTVNAALEFIRTHGGNSEQQQQFKALMDKTGIGNHPALIRIFANANRAFGEGRPLPAVKPTPAPASRAQKWYGGR